MERSAKEWREIMRDCADYPHLADYVLKDLIGYRYGSVASEADQRSLINLFSALRDPQGWKKIRALDAGWTFAEINEATHFADGPYWTSEADAREFILTRPGIDPDALEDMAAHVLRYGWHIQPR